MNSTELELNLYENAIDSIQHAIEHYIADTNERRRYKYAILHLSQGVALLLKERLKRVHPNFIFSSVTNEAKTVDVAESLIRLEKIARVDVEKHRIAIEQLFTTRNRIEHYSFAISKQLADSLIGKTVPFLAEFLREELNGDLEFAIGRENWLQLHSIEDYLNNAIKQAKERIERESLDAYLCGNCGDQTVALRKPSSNEFGITSRIGICLVCQEQTHTRSICYQCGKETTYLSTRGPYQVSWFCDECRTIIQAEFQGFRSPLVAGAVKKRIELQGWISGEEIDWLIASASYVGPTVRPSVGLDLFEKGLIDFINDDERQEYLREKPNSQSPFLGRKHRFKLAERKSE